MADEEDKEEISPTEHVADVVTDVTVRALREFSTGEMTPDAGNAGDAAPDADETVEPGEIGETTTANADDIVEADADVGAEEDAGDFAEADDDVGADSDADDRLAELPQQDTADLLQCLGNELDEINDPDAPDQPDDDVEPDELVVLDPDHPLMVRFQKALRTQLDRHNEKLKLDIAETLLSLRKKQKEREDIGVELYGVQYELANYQKALENLQVESSLTSFTGHFGAVKLVTRSTRRLLIFVSRL